MAAPVNWHEGEGVIIVTAVSNGAAKGKFPKEFRAVKRYARFTPQPSL